MAASISFPTKADFPEKDFKVSYENRNAKIQEIIDESFKVYVTPLHEKMIQGQRWNYREFGTEKYEFIDPQDPNRLVYSSKFLEKFAKNAKFSVLDLGTGNGRFIAGLKEMFTNVVVMGVSAADFRSGYSDARYIGIGGAWVIGNPDIKVDTLSENEYVVGNIENLSSLPQLKNKKFDLVISHMTFMHLSDPLGAMCQAYEMLNPQGKLLIDDFKLNGLEDSQKEYEKLFNQTNCQLTTPQITSTWGDQAKPRTTEIKKLAEGYLNLSVRYDLEKSTRADKNQKAQIFYKLDDV
jgi:ubiquinone/menaquinone biosynthesis C-methylase UbiE